ncbi:hypothetical protein PSTT_16572 [Puccinia striiformis]|uniref:Uncharacterized protein n=1 Tax=Puccinia striiformis TaxID=27350 RepID=A0A2S4UCA5_9BASI|nr:hypothetical protein PSTT_16572 [Puccinia striiformis]
MNKVPLFQVIQQSLPWAWFDDYLLRVAFDDCNLNLKVFSRTWAPFNARKLYLCLQQQVLESDIGLIADVWTTKGNHKAFIEILVCSINKKWQYVSQHLALQYLSWHHNRKYLAAPSANVIAKHALTTDSGRNNFTMVLALVLGSGLRALKLAKPLKPPAKTPNNFPTLDDIVEGDKDKEVEEIDMETLQLEDSEDSDKVDPDDVSDTSENANKDFEELSGGTVHNGGIGHTLFKSLIPGYGTRWNIAYNCWQRAYAAGEVIDELLEDKANKCVGKASMVHYYKGYEISKKAWENLNSLTIA